MTSTARSRHSDCGKRRVIDATSGLCDCTAAVSVSIKARGSDINFWGGLPAVRQRIAAAAASADGLLAVSAALADRMAAIGIDRDRITVHYTGIDAERFRPVDRAATRAALGIDGPLFVTVGTLNANKGQHLAIDAVAALPDATLVLVGEGPDRDRLAGRAADRGVTGRAAYADIQSRSAVVDDLAGRFQCKPEELPTRVEALQEQVKKLQDQVKKAASASSPHPSIIHAPGSGTGATGVIVNVVPAPKK